MLLHEKEVPFRKLIILYSDHELTGIENINYLVYEGDQRIHDSVEMKHAGLTRSSKTMAIVSANTEALKKWSAKKT